MAVPYTPPKRKDIEMKLLWISFAILAIALADEIKTEEKINDVEAEASENIDVLRIGSETLDPLATTYQSNYIPPSQRPQRPWNQNQNYAPPESNYVPPQNNYAPPQNNYAPPQNSYVPPQNNYAPPQNSYVPPQSSYVPPQNTATPPQNSYVPPQTSYVPPQNTATPPQNSYVPPQSSYVPPQNTGTPPQNSYVPPQSSYVPPQNEAVAPQNDPPQNWNQQQNNYHQHTWSPPQPTPSTTPATVIKDENIVYPDGSYRYEYKMSNGHWVGEEGFTKNRNTDNEIPVKKGWYSYPGSDGKIYTVTYYADESGYHAAGEHLPTPPPTPPEIQYALDQAAQAEKNQQQQGTTPATYYPQQPQQPYYPPQQQQTYYPQQSYPSYNGK